MYPALGEGEVDTNIMRIPKEIGKGKLLNFEVTREGTFRY